jgi:hypothetical protein
MASFAELDINNNVLGVYKGCDIDVQNNGGEQSEQAAKYFETIKPLSSNGVKYVQCSFIGAFRGRNGAIGGVYDPNLNVFINPKTHPSWVLDSNQNWIAPINVPITRNYDFNGQTYEFENIMWDENLLTWLGVPVLETGPEWIWNKDTLSWYQPS